jgi:hypothetical protein
MIVLPVLSVPELGLDDEYPLSTEPASP